MERSVEVLALISLLRTEPEPSLDGSHCVNAQLKELADALSAVLRGDLNADEFRRQFPTRAVAVRGSSPRPSRGRPGRRGRLLRPSATGLESRKPGNVRTDPLGWRGRSDHGVVGRARHGDLSGGW